LGGVQFGQDDYKYWLAHEYGHCLTLHSLSEEDGEVFAEKFAQHLVFPAEVAYACLETMRASDTAMTIAQQYATKYGVSIVTVLKATEELSKELHGKNMGLLNSSFWARWNLGRTRVPSMLEVLFGTDTPSLEIYLDGCERLYKTPVFKALTAFQDADGGRNPAFIAHALKISLGDAISLSHALWGRGQS
jgi:hypothetical protein